MPQQCYKIENTVGPLSLRGVINSETGPRTIQRKLLIYLERRELNRESVNNCQKGAANTSRGKRGGGVGVEVGWEEGGTDIL